VWLGNVEVVRLVGAGIMIGDLSGLLTWLERNEGWYLFTNDWTECVSLVPERHV
jgi:hypothetical protein